MKEINIPGWMRIMNLVNGTNSIIFISKSLDITYSHTAKTLYLFERKKLVTKTLKGREAFFKLTKRGEKIIDNLRIVLGELNELKGV